MTSPASIFISYSHADRELARALAEELRKHGLRVWIDEGELKVGDSLIERIATAIAEIDFFLALVSQASRNSNWCRKELALAVTGELGREGVKVLPVRVEGASMPESLVDVYYLDLTAGNVVEVAAQIAEAVPTHQTEAKNAKRHRRQTSARPITSEGIPGSGLSPSTGEEYEPIKILGIVEGGVGSPKNDGTRGSALYRIPLRLSRRPSNIWASHFVTTWNRPPRWTTMHRPGIASVSGDTVILDGTTMEELERYHVETLRHVLQKVNADMAEREREERARAEREAESQRGHDETVRDVAGRIKFD
ncbi:MAG: toll/interleukin-1 receptor domain-containing protein [Acidimicrobiia bacterium]